MLLLECSVIKSLQITRHQNEWHWIIYKGWHAIKPKQTWKWMGGANKYQCWSLNEESEYKMQQPAWHWNLVEYSFRDYWIGEI